MKNIAGDIIIFHMCTKNHNHMRYNSPLTTCKIKILKKMKKASGDGIILHMYTKNHEYMMYASWDMECLILRQFLPFHPTTAPKIKIKKNI